MTLNGFFFFAGFRTGDSKEKMWTLVKEKVKLKSKFHFWSLFFSSKERERERGSFMCTVKKANVKNYGPV